MIEQVSGDAGQSGVGGVVVDMLGDGGQVAGQIPTTRLRAAWMGRRADTFPLVPNVLAIVAS